MILHASLGKALLRFSSQNPNGKLPPKSSRWQLPAAMPAHSDAYLWVPADKDYCPVLALGSSTLVDPNSLTHDWLSIVPIQSSVRTTTVLGPSISIQYSLGIVSARRSVQ